jgi:hypothetical protein
MSKTPGRKPQYSPYRKKELSSDAKIIVALLRKQPKTKEEICKETETKDKVFYRNVSLLEKMHIIKSIDHKYALWDFEPVELKIEDAFSKLTKTTAFIGQDRIVNEVGLPWHEIEKLTFKIAKKLGLAISNKEGKTVFYKT